MDSAADDTIENWQMPSYPYAELYALITSLCQMKGNITLSIDRDHYENLTKYNPFITPFHISAEAYLEKLTQSPNDDSTIDAMAQEMGYPPNMSEILKNFVGKKMTVHLCDG